MGGWRAGAGRAGRCRPARRGRGRGPPLRGSRRRARSAVAVPPFVTWWMPGRRSTASRRSTGTRSEARVGRLRWWSTNRSGSCSRASRSTSDTMLPGVSPNTHDVRTTAHSRSSSNSPASFDCPYTEIGLGVSHSWYGSVAARRRTRSRSTRTDVGTGPPRAFRRGSGTPSALTRRPGRDPSRTRRRRSCGRHGPRSRPAVASTASRTASRSPTSSLAWSQRDHVVPVERSHDLAADHAARRR